MLQFKRLPYQLLLGATGVLAGWPSARKPVEQARKGRALLKYRRARNKRNKAARQARAVNKRG